MDFQTETEFITSAGLPAVIIYVTNNYGEDFRNGYVGVPKDSIYAYVTYHELEDSADIDIPVELTYSGPLDDQDSNLWFFGYDTAHSYDTTETRSIEAITENLELLAKALK